MLQKVPCKLHEKLMLEKVPGEMRGKLMLENVPGKLRGDFMLEKVPGELLRKLDVGKSAWRAALKTAEKVTDKVLFQGHKPQVEKTTVQASVGHNNIHII